MKLARLFAALALLLVLAPSGWPERLCGDEPAAKPASAGESAAEQPPPADDAETYELLRQFVDTLDEVERNYVQQLSRRELIEAAIQGVLTKLDQHSQFIPPDELDSFRTSLESEFGGVGIQVQVVRGGLLVISPLVDAPAYRAGILAGDIVTEINGESVASQPIGEATRRMKGPAGTEVKVTVRRPSDDSMTTYTLVRENVRVRTVLGDHRKEDDRWEFMLDDQHKIGYIQLAAFARFTTDELRTALDELQARGAKGLVLDLRFNPGGLLSAAVEVSDVFLKSGKIVSVSGRNLPEQSWSAHEEGTIADWPMVVLVNQFSASAAEIVAACLQDHDRAAIVGQRTFGKGSVQNVIELSGGKSALKMTTARYFRPNGQDINRDKGDAAWGVSPDDGLEVTLTDQQVQQVAEQRRARDLVRHAKPPPADKPADKPADQSADEPTTDPQLDAALKYLRQRLENPTKPAAGTNKEMAPQTKQATS